MSDDRSHRDFLERVFFETYKKEIDQEENVWRTLPFFSATVAFELASILQILFRINQLSRLMEYICLLIIGLFVTFLALMLWFLWQSVRKRQFSYPASEVGILNFAIEVESQAIAAKSPIPARGIKDSLQDNYIEQWGAAAEHNRQVNQLRAQFRERSARFLLLSIAALLILIICVALDPLLQQTGKSADVTLPLRSGSQESGTHENQSPKAHNL